MSFNSESIRTLMRERGLSARELARRVHVAPSLIGAWLGNVVSPQVGTLCRLCDEFGVGIAFFFNESDGESDKSAVAAARMQRSNKAVGAGR